MMSRWNRKLWALILAAGMTVSLAACGGNDQAAGGASAGTQDGTAAQQNQSTGSNIDNAGSIVTLAQDARALQIIDDNYRTYYEHFVYSFYDSDGDGIGDLQGDPRTGPGQVVFAMIVVPDLDFLVVRGRRGGSAITAAAVNAIA